MKIPPLAPKEEPKSLVILAGPPGAGKSTVARELVAQAAEPTAYIEGDRFWHFFPYSSEHDRRKGDFRTVMRASVQTAASYAAGGYPVILDFSIPPWYLGGVRKITASRGIAVHYVLLLPSEETCARRAAERSEDATFDYEVFHEFYATFKEMDGPVLTQELPPAELARAIRKGLESGIFLLSPPSGKN